MIKILSCNFGHVLSAGCHQSLVIPLPDDNEEAFILPCNVLHCQDSKVSHTPSTLDKAYSMKGYASPSMKPIESMISFILGCRALTVCVRFVQLTEQCIYQLSLFISRRIVRPQHDSQRQDYGWRGNHVDSATTSSRM